MIKFFYDDDRVHVSIGLTGTLYDPNMSGQDRLSL